MHYKPMDPSSMRQNHPWSLCLAVGLKEVLLHGHTEQRAIEMAIACDLWKISCVEEGPCVSHHPMISMNADCALMVFSVSGRCRCQSEPVTDGAEVMQNGLPLVSR